MNDDQPDPLLELFRSELREQSELLRGAIGDLRTAPGNRAPLEQAAQAAHTLRGAARLMQQDVFAHLAGQVEDRFTAALAGGQIPDTEELRRCLRMCDGLGEMAAADPEMWPALLAALEVPSGTTETKPSPPNVAVAADPMSKPMAQPEAIAAPATVVDPALVELFREEARSHGAKLGAGLLELERDPANPQRIEPLMRAAHSLKGASRIIGLDPAVHLAHDMEDAFVAAQSGRIRLSAAEIDVLLQGADLLATLAEENLTHWATAHGVAVSRLRALVVAIARGTAMSVPSAPVKSPKADVQAAAAPPLPVSPVPPAPDTGAPMEPSEAVVRVTAQSLDRLMSLAGESLVQSRWLQPFAGALLQVKKRQDRLTNLLDQLAGTAHSPARFAQTLADARREAAHGRQEIAERMNEFDDHASAAEDLNSRLYREVIVSRMRPFADGAHAFPRLVRDTARRLGKQARLDILGQTTEVDRDILEKLEAPLTHLLRNAIDHGLEETPVRVAAGKAAEGVIHIEARHRAGMLSITVSDDGAGIDVEKIRAKVIERRQATAEVAARLSEAELLEFLFLPGFSTAGQVTEVSGRGVGLDVVQDTMRKVGGAVHISTKLGGGTTFHLLLPITLSVLRAVLVDIAGEPYAFPHNRIDRLLSVPRADIRSLEHRQFITVDGRHVGLVLGSQLLDMPAEPPATDELSVLLLSDGAGSYGFIVETIRGEQDLVVRPLDPRLGKVPNVSAAAVLDDGAPVLIADVEDLIRGMDQFIQAGTLRRCDRAAGATARKRILVVDDSITVREVQRQILRTHGYEVEVATDGQDGLNKLALGAFALVVSDVDMPRMTGLEFVRRIRDDQALRELPVIIVSYKDREEDRLRGLQAGANHYLTKSSFHDDTFVEAVAGLIGRP